MNNDLSMWWLAAGDDTPDHGGDDPKPEPDDPPQYR